MLGNARTITKPYNRTHHELVPLNLWLKSAVWLRQIAQNVRLEKSEK